MNHILTTAVICLLVGSSSPSAQALYNNEESFEEQTGLNEPLFPSLSNKRMLISSPNRGEIVGSVYEHVYSSILSHDGKLAYVSLFNDVLKIIDVSEPAATSITSTLTI